jgi:signal transduction histidine kinase
MTTIRGRLLVLLLTGLTVVLAAGGGAVYWIAQAGLVRQLDTSLETRAHALASLVTQEQQGLVFDPEDLWATPMGETYYEFQTRQGEVLARSPHRPQMTPQTLPATSPEAWPSLAHPMRDLAEGAFVFTDIQLPDNVNGRAAWHVFRPRVDLATDAEDDGEEDLEQILAPSGAGHDTLIIALAVDRRSVDRALGTLLTALIAVGGVLGLTVGVLVIVGVRWGLGPLDRLGRQIGGVSGETISTRIHGGDAPRELTPVYHELNRMLDRVEGTLQRERTFAAAAAHELRTPLAELRAIAEVAIKWPDTDQADTALHEMLSIGCEMERLVESLLLISQGHAGSPPNRATAAPLRAIVLACIEHASEPIAQKDLHVTIALHDRDVMSAPREAVEIILRNLIDNAVQYTQANGSITVRLDDAADGARAVIVENGPVQLDALDVPRLFEPFWRGDASHSDRTHVGLGLTVVDQIARALSLQVRATITGDRRLQIRLSSRD